MEKFRVIFDLPKITEYVLDADYPGEAKSIAARLHQKYYPKLTSTTILIIFRPRCVRVHPKSSGRRYREPSFIEEMYKRYNG